MLDAGVADAVFLDLPSPWEVIPSAEEALFEDGKLVSFSPCIEQVHKTCEKLREYKFQGIKTIECLIRSYDVRINKLEKLDLSQFKQDSTTEHTQNKRRRTDFEGEETTEMDDHKGEEIDMETKQPEQEEKPNKTIPPRIQRIPHQGVVVRPFSDIRGHTGFLTFARKPVSSR